MIAAHENAFPIRWMCRRLGVSVSGYYAWKDRDASSRSKEDVRLSAEIRVLHKRSRGTYGSPRIHRDLKEAGFAVGRHRVARLMQEQCLRGRPPRRFKKTTDSSHSMPVAENLVARKFSSETPNRVWVADISYIRTWEGWLYLAVILDLCSRRVVGYTIADHMRAEIVVDAFEQAVRSRRPPPDLIHQSDRGSQYASKDFGAALRNAGAM